MMTGRKKGSVSLKISQSSQQVKIKFLAHLNICYSGVAVLANVLLLSSIQGLKL
jgi:hypothetical protein